MVCLLTHLLAPPPPVSPPESLSRSGTSFLSPQGRLVLPDCPGAGCGQSLGAPPHVPPNWPSAPRASYSESEVKDYLWQILSATQYLHAQGILHLDLRSENMIVTEYNLLKVIDFGNAQSLAQERVLPSERFKDYMETMGAQGADTRPDLGEGCAGSKPQSCPPASSTANSP